MYPVSCGTRKGRSIGRREEDEELRKVWQRGGETDKVRRDGKRREWEGRCTREEGRVER